MAGRRIGAYLLVALALLCASATEARAQACCVGASGLTPAWLAYHERFLVGAQVRLLATHGAYPSRGPFYEPTRGRDRRLETSLFTSFRILPRLQASVFLPFVTTRRFAGGLVETRSAFGDLGVLGRFDLLRTGESSLPGIAILGGVQAPTGTPSDRAAPLLAADVTGIGAWEVEAGVSIEHALGRVLVHATALAGVRAPRTVLGLEQRLGPRALYLVSGGYVFDGDAAVVVTASHVSEGDATLGGEDAPGTGSRTTQLALLVVAPVGHGLRVRVSAFTDVPPLGENRAALGGTALSVVRSW